MPGVNVMITIFRDLDQFSAKKMTAFSKINVMKAFSAKITVCILGQRRPKPMFSAKKYFLKS
jgi:hypothetical protein